MGSYLMVQDGKLYYVEDGKAVVLEEHYRNEIERYGNELLEEVNGRHRVHEAERVSYTSAAAEMEESFFDRRMKRMYQDRQAPVIQGEARDRSGSVWLWLLAGAVLAGLLVWWW